MRMLKVFRRKSKKKGKDKDYNATVPIKETNIISGMHTQGMGRSDGGGQGRDGDWDETQK